MSLPPELENAVLRNLLAQTTAAYDEQLQAVLAEKELAQVTLSSIADGVVATDARGRVRFLNPTAERMTGWSSRDATGQALEEILHLLDDVSGQAVPLDLEASLRSGERPEPTRGLAVVRRDGRRFAISSTVSAICDPEGRRVGAVLVFRDVTEKQLLDLQLAHQASHDAVTGLLNRQAFERRLETTLAAVRRPHAAPATLCHMDLDQFKLVNDTCGHAAGDQLLAQVAALLQDQMGSGDLLARLGDDEFGMLFADCDADRGLDRARRAKDALSGFQFHWHETKLAVTASIGVVPLDPSFGGVADLFSAADHACGLAKEKGRGRVQLYQPDDAELQRRHGEMQWVVRIQETLRHDRFALLGQPIRPADGRSGKLSFEVLLRMQREDGVLLPPRDFIRAAERYELMPQIDIWVLRRVLAELAALPAAAMEHLGMCSINLSARSVGDEGFLALAYRELEQWRLPPALLCLEITETAALSNLDQALRLMQELRRLGCRFALDDFGSGMFSYGSLKKLPVDFLKIDGSFVQDLLVDPLDRAMVESINRLGHLIGVETVAESVASGPLAAALREMGVDHLQGFWIGRPQPLEDVCRLAAPA